VENALKKQVKACLLCLYREKNVFKITNVVSRTQMDTMDSNISVNVCSTIPKII